MSAPQTIISLAGEMKWAASTDGGEYAGPCPWCGGKDRFRVWPNHVKGQGGRFMCRQCGLHGDGIDFIREQTGMGYLDACKALNVKPAQMKSLRPAREVQRKQSAPVETRLPARAWSQQALQFIAMCSKGFCPDSLGFKYALSRGLTLETIKKRMLVWNSATSYDTYENWGLQPEIKRETGKPRKIWLPEGLVIPTVQNNLVRGIKIRRADWSPDDTLPKYAAVKGGSNMPYVLSPELGKPVVVLEGELDALLVDQAAGDSVTSVALRTAKGRPDVHTNELLRAAPLILVSLDTDAAGIAAAKPWRQAYGKAKRWPTPDGKDVGEFLQMQGDVRLWIEAALTHFLGKQGSKTKGASRELEQRDFPNSNAMIDKLEIKPGDLLSYCHDKDCSYYWTDGSGGPEAWRCLGRVCFEGDRPVSPADRPLISEMTTCPWPKQSRTYVRSKPYPPAEDIARQRS